MSQQLNPNPASFRDPNGYVVHDKAGKIYRVISGSGVKNYELLVESGLYQTLSGSGQLISHSEVTVKKKAALKVDDSDVLIAPKAVPFISYPYEWSFSQTKAAALLTLDIMKQALDKGLILKDASAYNVQFIGTRPVFIDTSSFEEWDNTPWFGYKQFCQHFLAPLALSSYCSPYAHRLSSNFIDGIPLDVASSMLPAKAKIRPGIGQHIVLHAKSQSKHSSEGEKKSSSKAGKRPTISAYRMKAIIDSLERTVSNMHLGSKETEWGDYYTFTNYSKKSFTQKHEIIDKITKKVNPKIAWDLGANNGEFSQIAAKNGAYTIAFDIDPVAVDKSFNTFKEQEELLPLLLDLTTPSASIGWALEERESILNRGPADIVYALALIHHICISNNVPLEKFAAFLSSCGKNAIVEFVPKNDSKVKTLLATREDIFPDYTQEGFEEAFTKYFKIISSTKIKGSARTLYHLKKK